MDLEQSINQVVADIGNTEDKLIEILIEVQRLSEYNYLSEEALKLIACKLDISLSKVYGVTSFYSMLSTKKRGKYVIQICNSAPCYLNGGKQVAKEFKDILGINIGEVTEDGIFSLEHTSCIGACDQAPAVKINDKLYGNLNRGKIFKIITSLRKEAM